MHCRQTETNVILEAAGSRPRQQEHPQAHVAIYLSARDPAPETPGVQVIKDVFLDVDLEQAEIENAVKLVDQPK